MPSCLRFVAVPETPARDEVSGGGMPSDSLSLAERIGQMVMAGFPGPTVSPEIGQLIAERHLGGAILFARNCTSPQQVRELTACLQEMSKRPLFIAIDQEGGIVARLQHPVTVFPSNMALAAAQSAEYVERAALMSAQALASVGVNVNFAPDVDVNSNPLNPVIGIRSFGEDTNTVAAMATAAVRGYQEGGVIATAKHFPGHGNTATDSHLALPVVSADMATLVATELPPFIAAIAAGVGMIMASHVMFPAIGATGPSTLAPEVLTGLLRNKMHYDGLICTDCMEMKAITDCYDIGEAAVLAVEAGADLVLVSHHHERQVQALDALLAAARSGRLPRERIDASVARILRAKQRLAARAETTMTFPNPAHEKAALDMARAATTLLKNEGNVLPLNAARAQSIAVVEFVVRQPTQVENDLAQPSLLRQLLQARLPGATLALPSDPSAEQAESVRRLAAASDVTIFATRNASRSPEQANAVRAALRTGTTGIVIAMRAPYDIIEFPQAAAHVATYGDPPCSVQAAVEVLFGSAHAGGRLPVTLPGMYKRGAGLAVGA